MAEIHDKPAPRPPSRLRLAFANTWNLVALGACAALTLVTRSPAPLAIGAVVEGAWLAFATRPNASRAIFRARHAAADAQARRALRQTLTDGLRGEDVERVARLEDRRTEIVRLAADHRHIASEVLLAEVARLEEIVDDFCELASTCARSEAYLGSVDLADLDSETRRYEETAERAVDDEQRALAKKNLAVLLRQREQVDELRKKVTRTRGQMELIESTFRMIGNEIMLMRTTDQLRGQLDDLVVGVQAVREMTAPAEPDANPDPRPAATTTASATTEDDERARAARAAAATTGTAQGQGRR